MPPSTDGQWAGHGTFNIASTTIDDGFGVTMPDTRGLFVLHAILLHTGKILCFSGHVEISMYAPLYYLFDPAHPGALMAPIAFPGRPDLFCCHYVQLGDGRILAAGGSQHDTHAGAVVVYQGSEGAKTIAAFDPAASAGAGQWTLSSSELAQGRWYPTIVLLPDGRAAVFSGRREHGSGVPNPSIADEVEVIDPSSLAPTTLTGATKALPIYPGLHLAKDGKIYFTHTCWGQEMPNPDTCSIAIGSGATSASWKNYAGLKPPNPRREEGMSVPLPAVQDGKILVIGGSKALKSAANGNIGVLDGPPPYADAAFDHIENAADPMSANILNTNTDPPTWSSAGTMAKGRTNGHCVLLPDATVFICGGHNKYKWRPTAQTQPSLEGEIFKEGVGFRTVAAATDPRMYHSVALLLPDGRVWTAGGANPNLSEPSPNPPHPYPAGWNPERQYGPGMAQNMKTFEFYEPPYMHNGPRPTITDVKRNNTSIRRIEYGKTFVITTSQAASINAVALMRPGACTHHTDTEQRYVRLTFTKGTNLLNVTMVNDRNVAPPGYYMLWIVDSSGRPCERAVFVRLLVRGSSSP
ncbi:MAG TPA: galactose oxidase-like domain-containing protein [Vicinamibacterales bacterium]|nr:galactose oxidase-like domain-containing protein [Vicinamibacterales bacterium]